MTQIHTCYTTSIALKKFLHNSCPEPLDKCYWINEHGDIRSVYKEEVQEWYIPIFCLHDLLSKPFCEAFVKVGAKKFGFDEDEITDFVADWSTDMAYAYWNGGLEAVEAALMKMMDGEK